MHAAPSVSARRELRGSKSVVVVRVDDRVETLGGNRAARAAAVVVTGWTSRNPAVPVHYQFELRADAAAAESLAALNVKPNRKYHGVDVTPALFSVAVLVTETAA